jgi:hypothetical protein
MINQWNQEIKRQGSRSLKSKKQLSQKIKEVAQQELDLLTAGKSLSKKQRTCIAKQINDLYADFPLPMVGALHEEYEKEVKKGIRSYMLKN